MDTDSSQSKELQDKLSKNTEETLRQLEELAKNDYDEFLDEANVYYYQDRAFYDANIVPLIHKYRDGSVTITCPFCKNEVKPLRTRKITGGGIFLIVLGIIFAPVLIGIIFIILGLSMRREYTHCPVCKIKLG